jgi:hypothetical protein
LTVKSHSRQRPDFHTRRREYVSALATSGANEQTAMALAHHSDSKVHRRYQIAKITRVPEAALPQINATTLASFVPGGDDSRSPLVQGADFRAGHGIRSFLYEREAKRTVGPRSRASTGKTEARVDAKKATAWGRRLRAAERDTGFEPATSSLGSWHSTN